MSTLDKDFFARSSEIVASNLIGRTVKAGTDGEYGLEVVETGAYEGETRTTGEGFYHEPGNIYIHNLPGGHNVLAVSTESTDKASVVAFRTGLEEESRLEDYRQLLDGPGRFSDYLDVTKDYDGISIDSDRLWIEGDAVDENLIEFISPEDKDMPENCLGYWRFSTNNHVYR